MAALNDQRCRRGKEGRWRQCPLACAAIWGKNSKRPTYLRHMNAYLVDLASERQLGLLVAPWLL